VLTALIRSAAEAVYRRTAEDDRVVEECARRVLGQALKDPEVASVLTEALEEGDLE
jgi:hypothetical protein